MPKKRTTKTLESIVKNCEWDGDCLIWQGDRTSAGYPVASKDGVHRTSGRALVLELAGKPRPPGAIAIATCGCKPCLNLEHLKWGTRTEAQQAAAARGVFNRPDHIIRNRLRHIRILSDEAVSEIRASGKNPATVAQEWGISLGYAQKIIAYRARVPVNPFAGAFMRLAA